MDLNNINVEIRPRPPYEGIDLGFAMGARWFFRLWMLWLMTALPLAVIINLIFINNLKIGLLILWWLKPVFETPLLYWISRALFNEKPEAKSIFRNYIRIIKPQIFQRLTFRRLSPNRSFYMPCILLENMMGGNYRKRTMILGSNQTAGSTLTFISLLFEILLFITISIILSIMIPNQSEFFKPLELFTHHNTLDSLIKIIIAVFSASFIAPFYVASGFALYISRRTELEAWDIELNFKRLVKRKKESGKILSIIGIFIFVFLLSPFINGKIHAQVKKQEAKLIIQEIVKKDDFGKKEKKNVWQLKKWEKKKKKKKFNLPDFINDIFEIISLYAGIIIKVIIWTGAGIALVFIIYFAGKNMGYFESFTPHKRINPPKKLFGLELTENSLPENIFESAMELILSDRLRKALSLLYRGALFKYTHVDLIEIPESATEGECIKLIFKKGEDREFDFFTELTTTWIKNAYGHIRPEKDKMENLCLEWKNYYERKNG